MTAKQKLMDYIQNLTPEEEEKLVSRLDLLKRCLTITDNQAIYTNILTRKLFEE